MSEWVGRERGGEDVHFTTEDECRPVTVDRRLLLEEVECYLWVVDDDKVLSEDGHAA